MQSEKLCQEYKKIKCNNGLTGRGRGKWRFYNAMDEILGTHPATCPPVGIDTTEDATEPVGDSFPLSDGEKENSDRKDNCEQTTDSTSALLDVDINSSAPEPATYGQLKRSKKRRRGKVMHLKM